MDNVMSLISTYMYSTHTGWVLLPKRIPRTLPH